jgi:glycosyltransferase involved in cell wall biosynthesis
MPEMISIVVPCLNEQEVLRDTNRRLLAVLEQLPLKF